MVHLPTHTSTASLEDLISALMVKLEAQPLPADAGPTLAQLADLLTAIQARLLAWAPVLAAEASSVPH